MENNKHLRFERGSGILLHITSLPGKFGIGNLGGSAFEFADYLAEGGQKYWQILPLGPVSSGYSFSPYSSYSAFAGNHLFIDPVSLQSETWMRTDILAKLKVQDNEDFIDFDKIEAESSNMLGIAYKNFIQNASTSDNDSFYQFCRNNEFWLNDYSLFNALSNRFHSFNWRSWEEKIRKRDPGAVSEYTSMMTDEIEYTKFVQYIFDQQWKKLKDYCNKNNILLIGDIPIYAGMDSVDVWANTNIFQFSEDLSPTGVSGVPPDYFSESGQKWGTPLYKWFLEG
ncbi:MAG: 4-alpha-glucanotransferase, partial [Candidatus Aminicenantes bacterium]|nr:4-alpha-glucanotransferase [Candidatus Aminicenantes bacterium]